MASNDMDIVGNVLPQVFDENASQDAGELARMQSFVGAIAVAAFGLGFIAWSPLASGLLSGQYRRDTPPPEGSRLGTWKDTMRRMDRDVRWRVVEELVACAAELDTAPATLALAWSLAKPGMTSVIIGARTVAQLADNLAADALTVPVAILDRLDAASRPEEWGYPYDFIARVDGAW
jgi:aryl-alcohol dehydrogenase-like predicted oxidoreductase